MPQRLFDLHWALAWIICVLYPQDLFVLKPITLGSLIVFVKYTRSLELLIENGVNKEMPVILITISLCYLSFHPQAQLLNRHSTRKRLTVGNYFSTFKNLLNPPPPPSVTSLSADDCNFSAQFSNPPKPVWPYLDNGLLLHSFSPLNKEEVSMLLRVVLQHVPWTPFQPPFSRP